MPQVAGKWYRIRRNRILHGARSDPQLPRERQARHPRWQDGLVHAPREKVLISLEVIRQALQKMDMFGHTRPIAVCWSTDLLRALQ